MKYTKQQLVEAFETFARSNAIIKDICKSVEPVVENAVNACVEKAKDIQFMKDEAGSFLTLKKGVSIISPLFKSFIELYFVDDRRLATVRKSELSKDEIEDCQWEYIKDYRDNSDAEHLYNNLDVDALSGAVVRLRLEPDSKDIATIYEAEDFAITHEGDQLVLRAGSTELGRLPAEALA